MAQTEPEDPRYTSADAALIRHKVSRTIGQGGFNRSDEEDLRQELALHVFTQMPKYDPARAKRSTFVDRIVSNKVNSIVRGANRQKRDWRREVPLEEASHVPARTPGERQQDLAIDVKRMVSGMDADRAEVAGRFMDGDRVADVVRCSGKSRQQVRLIAKKLSEDLSSLAPERKCG